MVLLYCFICCLNNNGFFVDGILLREERLREQCDAAVVAGDPGVEAAALVLVVRVQELRSDTEAQSLEGLAGVDPLMKRQNKISNNLPKIAKIWGKKPL